MKCLCPACRRTTRIESHLVDFFTRCDRCGVLLRPKAIPQESTKIPADATEKSPQFTVHIVAVGRLCHAHAKGNGQLAELLSRPPSPVSVPGAEKFSPPPVANTVVPPRSGTMSRRVMLQRHHRTLGIIGFCGTGLIALFAIGALVIRIGANFHFKQPAPDTVHAAKGF